KFRSMPRKLLGVAGEDSDAPFECGGQRILAANDLNKAPLHAAARPGRLVPDFYRRKRCIVLRRQNPIGFGRSERRGIESERVAVPQSGSRSGARESRGMIGAHG